MGWRAACRIVSAAGFGYVTWMLGSQILVLAVATMFATYHTTPLPAGREEDTLKFAAILLGLIVFVSILLRDIANGLDRKMG